MLWYAVQNVFFFLLADFFSPSPSSWALLIWWGHRVHELSSHKAAAAAVSAAKDVDLHRVERTQWTAETGTVEPLWSCVVFLCGAWWTHQLAGWFKTFDSSPASVMAIRCGTSIEKRRSYSHALTGDEQESHGSISSWGSSSWKVWSQ